MDLVRKETIKLTTPQGVSEVQLLFGNIANLPLEEKVDAIFVSSFPGDYTAIPSTLIGSLKRHLGINVGKLAQNKELNLLHKFNCWVSRTLPDHLPFRRLVCFERKNKQEITEQISGIFRAMMPVFNNQDTSVITPLLATGNQGASKEEILKSTVMAACHWIMAGLSLKCLKIVVYVPNCHDVPQEYVKLITQFQQYKKKWEMKTGVKKETEEKKYDVCLSYAGKDLGLASEICSDLLKVDANIVIFKDLFTYDHKSVWQEQIFKVMASAHRIIAVLTPNYTEEVECLDQFNLALCCNRQSGCDVLVPFYLQTVSSFPSYMTLIQYTDCRVRKEGDKKEEKIIVACSMLVEDLSKEKTEWQMTPKPKHHSIMALDREASYDIFISYAHRTPKEAGLMYEALQKADCSLKIFLDRNELRTGNVWQETLYEAVDSARLVLAFISSSYLQSTVCQEEYNIALARYLTQDGVYFIPVLTEDIKDIPSSFARTPIVDLRDPERRDDTKTYRKLAASVIEYLRKGQHNQFCQPEKKWNMIAVLDEWRRHLFRQRFQFDTTDIIRLKEEPQPTIQDTAVSRSPKTVALSFTSDCLYQASVLSHLLKSQTGVKMTVEFLTAQASGTQASKLLDTADMVVIFLSDDYLTSVQHRTELHIALCRQRTSKEHLIVYLIEAHHATMLPVYSRLLPHSINLADKHWFGLAREAGKLKQKESFKVQLPDGMEMRVYCTGLEYMGLLTAAIDVADKLVNGASGNSGIPTNIINLARAKDLGEPGTEPVEQQHLVPVSALNKEATRQADLNSYQGQHRQCAERMKQQLELKRSSACQLL